MKSQLLFVFALLAFVLASLNADAVSIVMDDVYSPGETVIGRIDGNFLTPLSRDDIYFYEGRSIIPMIYDLVKISDSYYFYAVLPVKAADYVFMIANAHFFEGGKELRADILKNFTAEGDIIDFSVNPAFVITNKDFDVLVKNYGSSLQLSVKYPSTSKADYVSIGYGDSEKLSFSISGAPESSVLEISSNLTTYSIPAVILTSSTVNASYNISLSDLIIIPNSLAVRALKNDSAEKYFNITLENNGADDITNVQFSFPEKLGNIVEFTPQNFSVISAGSIVSTVMTVFPIKTANFTSEVIAYSADNPDSAAYMSLFLEILPSNYTKLISNDPSIALENYTPSVLSSCLSLNGRICLSGEVCDGGQAVDSKEGSCCIGGGMCVIDSSTGVWSKIIIVILLLGIAIVGIIIFRKYKGVKSPADILKQRQNSYDKMIKK